MNATLSVLPVEVAQTILQWVGSKTPVVYWWEQDGTYFVVAKSSHTIYFLRLFKIGDEYTLSQDHECVA